MNNIIIHSPKPIRKLKAKRYVAYIKPKLYDFIDDLEIKKSTKNQYEIDWKLFKTWYIQNYIIRKIDNGE